MSEVRSLNTPGVTGIYRNLEHNTIAISKFDENEYSCLENGLFYFKICNHYSIFGKRCPVILLAANLFTIFQTALFFNAFFFLSTFDNYL